MNTRDKQAALEQPAPERFQPRLYHDLLTPEEQAFLASGGYMAIVRELEG